MYGYLGIYATMTKGETEEWFSQYRGFAKQILPLPL